MQELAESIQKIIKDYRNEDGVQLTDHSILDWAIQFGDDAEFILAELNHILPKAYLSKEKAREYTRDHIKSLIKLYKCNSIQEFLADSEFLDMQKDGKSQKSILILIEEVLNSDYGESYKNYISYPKKNFAYFDDVLATGGTIGWHLIDWLNRKQDGKEENFKRLIKGDINLSIHLFCLHTWGYAFQLYRLKKYFTDSIEGKIVWFRNYEIQNHVKWNNQSLNIAIPTKEQPANVKTYLANLPATKYEDYAYRRDLLPVKESFFTSPQNRIKYENLILQKGLSIIDMIQGEIKTNIRPLGFVSPEYKIYGLGTHFFTWRNVPNNSPLVFWWEVQGHDWKPLFPVANRGQN